MTAIEQCDVHRIVDGEEEGEGCGTQRGAIEDGDRIGIPSGGWAELWSIESNSYKRSELYRRALFTMMRNGTM